MLGPTYINRRGYSAGNYKGHLNRCLEVEGLRKATSEHGKPISRTCFAGCSAVLTLCPSSVGKKHPALLREQGSATVQSAQNLAQSGLPGEPLSHGSSWFSLCRSCAPHLKSLLKGSLLCVGTIRLSILKSDV